MGEVSSAEAPVRELVDRFYRSFLAADEAGLSRILAPGAALVVQSDTVLSGSHVGSDGIGSYRSLIHELTGGTWRPFREDSFDLTVSPWHGVVLDRYLAERGNLRLDSHEAIVLAVEDGLIVRLFHYVHDPAAYAFFWAA